MTTRLLIALGLLATSGVAIGYPTPPDVLEADVGAIAGRGATGYVLGVPDLEGRGLVCVQHVWKETGTGCDARTARVAEGCRTPLEAVAAITHGATITAIQFLPRSDAHAAERVVVYYKSR